MFRALQELSPYHEQGWNIDVLESNSELHAGGEGTRTCNVTSLGMALESLGLSPADYVGSTEKVVAAAKYFNKASSGHGDAKEKDGTKVDGRHRLEDAQRAGQSGTTYEALQTLRIPDFLELAIIAHFAEGTSDAEIDAGAKKAWNGILNMGNLQALAKDFGAKAELKFFNMDPHKEVQQTVGKGKRKHTITGEAQDFSSQDTDMVDDEFGSQGKKASLDKRHAVDKLIDARNRYEAETDPTKKAELKETYDTMRKPLESALTGEKIEKQTPLKAYAQAVIDTIGQELSQGKAVETHVINHFIRVREVTPEYVIIDDPSQSQRAHKKVTWEEARASGMFGRRLVISVK